MIKTVRVGAHTYGLHSEIFSPSLVRHSKAVPGMRFDWGNKLWVGSIDAVYAVVSRMAASNIRVDMSVIDKASDSDRLLAPLPGLRPYQVEGVKFLLEHSSEGCILADGMRLGKTCQAITVLGLMKRPAVVIAPSHAIGVWERELARWAGYLSIHVCETTKPVEIKADVALIHYEIVKDWISTLRGREILILDEAHMLIGHSSKRAEAIRNLASQAKYRIALTGTPMTGSPSKMFNLLDTVCPGRFGFFFRHDQDGEGGKIPIGTFSRVFCNAFQKEVGSGPEKKLVWDWSGSANLASPDGDKCLVEEETLRKRLSYLMLRRTKQEVDKDLPSKERQIVDIRVPAKAAVGLESWIGNRGSGDELRRILDRAADSKFKPLVAMLRQDCLDEARGIAFCYRRSFAEALAKALYDEGCFAIFSHGGLSSKERESRIQHWRESEIPGVLCCTIDTTATAIDLSTGDVSTFCELVWEPHELIQAEERSYKVGGNHQFIRYVIARGTGDELILRNVISKLDNFEAAIGQLDGMKEALAVKKNDGLRRLHDALRAM